MEKILVTGIALEVQHIQGASAQSRKSPLVFLHEGLGSLALWRDWPTQLCQASGRAGWVYSRRGYGQSDTVPDVRGPARVQGGQRIGRLRPDYLHEEAWTVLPQLLEVLQVEKPLLIGHSDGGSIALLHASRFDVAACVVMAPHVFVEDISIRAIAEARVAYEQGDLRARLARYHANVDCAFWQWNDVWLSDAFRSFDIRENCRSITAPLMAIQGFDDPYGSLLQIDEIAKNLKKKGLRPPNNIDFQLYKLEHCGHSPHRDQTELTTRLIADFLSDVQ